ncbi:MAG: immunoglobulin domain-containing protein [Propionibacteriaceae bacterium]|nr:immunoglobulin domain-containing protein [Propionibacteriaceae bacterium]
MRPATTIPAGPPKNGTPTHMSRIKRLLAGAASAALLLSLVAPATSQAEDAVAPTHHAGACVGDTGVTVVIDYQKLGGAPDVRCATGSPEDGVEAVRNAGFSYEGVQQWGDAFACRLNDRPAADEVFTADGDDYTETCVKTPPANAYWSYWHSNDEGRTWEYSNLGASGYTPKPGEWEGWSFSLDATASTNPEPRTGLTLAPYDNAESTQAAAAWLASQWDPAAKQFPAGLADGISAFAAAGTHPEIVSEMVEAIRTADTGYFSAGADSLAKMLIALDMAGQDTQHFLGCDRDLVAELDTYIADGARSLNNWWGPQLVTIALNRLGKPVPQNVWDLLAKRQVANGSFGSPDDTGLALSALVGTHENELNTPAMRDAAKVAIDKAVAWANNPANQKTKDGNYYWATFSAANSTGMLGAGLAEAGVDISSPQAFMRAQQKLTGVGAWQSVLDRTAANYMATNQGILAVAGKGYGKASLEVPRTNTTCSVAPAFTTQPASTTVTAGDTATFTVAVTGDPTPGITWEKDVNGIWTAIQGATGTTLTLANVGNDHNGLKVRAVAANAASLAVSDIATLTVKPAVSPTPSTSTPPTYPATVYNTPGYHKVNGRNWFTSCEPYSITQRCRTLIEATSVKEVGGHFVATNGWVFNNLTYLPSPKSTWAGNPLSYDGTWAATDGREWKTECNTPQTGGNGCRSYVQARVVANIAKPGQKVRYGWITKWEFNNIVQFS